LDGRSVKDALLAPIRKVEVVKGGCSVVSPFTKNDTWTQNLGDEELRLQLWKKIVLNDEFKRYILCFAFSSVYETCTDNDLFPFPTTVLLS
jgi:hypothetical protein